MIFLTFFIIPVIIALVAFLVSGGKISLKELGIQMGAQLLVIGMMVLFISHRNTLDFEMWNGRITKKDSKRVSCEHSYSCNCRTRTYSCGTSDKPRTCTKRVCDTCYEHSYDVNWYAYDSTDQRFRISRVDRRGLSTPPRWEAIQVGEPTSSSHMYTNYIKGNPDSLFRKTGLVEQYKDSLPVYPGKIYDYYRLNRLVTIGVNIPDAHLWNQGLSEINGDLGKSKQVNAIVVVVQDQPREWFGALEQQWLGGKKNDAIAVIGVNSELQIQWVEIAALSEELFKIKLRDAVYNVGSLDREKILAEIRSVIQNDFIRKPMKDFEYLSATAQPSAGEWAFGLIIGILVSVGLSYVFYRSEL